MKKILLLFILATAAALGQNMTYFRVAVECGAGMWQDTSFVIAASNPALIAEARAELDKPLEERRIVNGPIEYGSGGFNVNGNLEFNWHHLPDQWAFADFTTEVCDGCPYTDLHTNTAYWVDTVRYYCPWSGNIVAEIPPPVTGIEDSPIAYELIAAPNPANDFISVFMPEDYKGEVKIIDLYGRQFAAGEADGRRLNINISQLPSGFYIIRTEKGAGFFVKQR